MWEGREGGSREGERNERKEDHVGKSDRREGRKKAEKNGRRRKGGKEKGEERE